MEFVGLRDVVHWDELGTPGPDTLVRLYFVKRRAGISYEAFEAHYRERHAPLARVHHPGVARYVQHFLDDPKALSGAYDAVSELWFRSERDLRERLYRDAASRRVIAEDVARFLEPTVGFAVTLRSPAGS